MLLSFDHPLEKDKAVEFFELFNEKLLLKQEEENLRILDVSVHTSLPPPPFPIWKAKTPSAPYPDADRGQGLQVCGPFCFHLPL